MPSAHQGPVILPAQPKASRYGELAFHQLMRFVGSSRRTPRVARRTIWPPIPSSRADSAAARATAPSCLASSTPFRSRRSGGSRRCRGLPLPVAVESSLHLHKPNDRRDDQDPAREEPEAGPAAHRPLLPVLLVHLPDLRWDHERLHRVEQDPDDEAKHPAEALARVLLDLLLGLENPVPRVEVERDDEHKNPKADSTRPAGSACAAGRAHSCLLRLGAEPRSTSGG